MNALARAKVVVIVIILQLPYRRRVEAGKMGGQILFMKTIHQNLHFISDTGCCAGRVIICFEVG
jgi:hypothetical protein